MKNSPVRHRLEYVLYRAVKGLLLALPHATVRRIGAALGRLAYRLDRRRRRRTLANLALVFPNLPEAKRRATACGCFEHFGATFFEIVSAARFTPGNVAQRFELAGWERLEEAIGRGRGVFLMSGHFGSWELATYPLGCRLGGIDMVARPPDNPWIEADLAHTRERFGNRLIGKRGAGHRMLNALRRRGRVAIVLDQRVRRNEGILVPFMGHPARTSTVLAYLSLVTRAPVVPVFCFPLDGGRYRLEVHPAIDPAGFARSEDDTGDETVARLTAEYMRVVGAEVARHPELWLWMHRRWED